MAYVILAEFALSASDALAIHITESFRERGGENITQVGQRNQH
jgi:hypothetical protein